MSEIKNKFLVGFQGENDICILAFRARISKEDAIALAAWLVVVADPGGEAFEKALAEVKAS